ncbi:IPT/TIG domain-containing protein [Enterococcus thailandicus]
MHPSSTSSTGTANCLISGKYLSSSACVNFCAFPCLNEIWSSSTQ